MTNQAVPAFYHTRQGRSASRFWRLGPYLSQVRSTVRAWQQQYAGICSCLEELPSPLLLECRHRKCWRVLRACTWRTGYIHFLSERRAPEYGRGRGLKLRRWQVPAVVKSPERTLLFFRDRIWPGIRHPFLGLLVGYIPVGLSAHVNWLLINCRNYLPSDGCSKPKSLMARISSGFNKKSLW